MGSYWYFAATLPTLQLGAPAAMTSERFLEMCRANLDAKDLALVQAARKDSGLKGVPPEAGANTFLSDYYVWERGLRNELARSRAKRLSRAVEAWIRPGPEEESASRSARAALEAGTPLEGELILERERWTRIEALRGLRTFDLEALLAYRFQLQILERLASLAAEAGEARYREVYAAILGGANENGKTGDDR